IVTYCRQTGIKILTVYAFSTENWKRPKREVDTLMGFVKKYLDIELANFKKNEIRLNFIGRLDKLPSSVEREIRAGMDQTKGCSKMLFNVALNYGSRNEIVDAVNEILKDGRKSVDEEAFSSFLYTRGQPDPDLLIRTSGEMRISNFLLWQLSYSELYFIDKPWPEFRRKDLEKAIEAYQQRQRRFGG
ncbi:MAG: polyprenyl diphosphate synthase, partial [Candidatus Omnitrophota bacterium]